MRKACSVRRFGTLRWDCLAFCQCLHGKIQAHQTKSASFSPCSMDNYHPLGRTGSPNCVYIGKFNPIWDGSHPSCKARASPCRATPPPPHLCHINISRFNKIMHCDNRSHVRWASLRNQYKQALIYFLPMEWQMFDLR